MKSSKKDLAVEIAGVVLRDAVDMGFAGFFFCFGMFWCARIFGIL